MYDLISGKKMKKLSNFTKKKIDGFKALWNSRLIYDDTCFIKSTQFEKNGSIAKIISVYNIFVKL